jgi:glycosyltransferase involved in cell wall biosynthesis
MALPLKAAIRRAGALAGNYAAALQARFAAADVALFHEFVPPPAGGGHQFMRALEQALRARGWRVAENRLPPSTPACLINSFNFDPARLRLMARRDCRIVHRVDGPVASYRGTDDGTDRRVWAINREFASATILQSRYSLAQHEALGLPMVNPTVVRNTVDPAIFHARGRRPWRRDRKVRIVSSSWSTNPNKGQAIYTWLDAHLDFRNVEYTFVGRVDAGFANIRATGPLASPAVADVLRDHDIYLTASRNDPCSNALLEALACGLPALYLNSGGHPELAGDGGLPFDAAEDVPARLAELIETYEARQSAIAVPAMDAVCDAYLAVLGLPAAPPA